MKRYIWPTIGLSAVVFSAWLLYHELRGISLNEVWDSLVAISHLHWLLCIAMAILAYAALAGYDHLALQHIRKRVGWFYITFTSFTTYALSHNIGASVFSGSVVRYRGYSTKGLTAADVGVMVAFCSFTFALATVFLAGLVLVIEPTILERFVDMLPLEATTFTGWFLLGLVGLYVIGSTLKLPPLRFGSIELAYPRLSLVARQLIIGPLEIAAAAAIIYFALPAAGNPGYVVVLGIFLVSFSLALLSHAPGGLGVLEIAFIAGLSEMDPVDVIAALLIFRLLYLLVPLVIALFIVLGFERRQLSDSYS